MAKLVVTDLTKYYGSVKALDRVNLEISDGQLAVIVGPSGCGKTTLMRCIVGLETFSEGSIFIDNELVNDRPPKDRDVAMVFQQYALYPHMTAQQNMSLGLQHTTDLSKAEIEKNVEEMAELLRIKELLKRKPGQLSGGESQRVAIGRALVRKPKVFFLDEPLSAIDAKLKRELRTEIKRIQKSFRVTTLYVTHDQEEAMAVGDVLVVLLDGKIRQIGTPEEVFNFPRDQFVGGFIGKPQMNFIKTQIHKRNDYFFLENDDFVYEISNSYYRKYLSNFEGANLILGVRPSAVRIVEKNSKVENSKINTSTVSLIENVGDDLYVFSTFGSNIVVIKSSADDIISIGQEIRFTFEEDDAHLFDGESKLSLKA